MFVSAVGRLRLEPYMETLHLSLLRQARRFFIIPYRRAVDCQLSSRARIRFVIAALSIRFTVVDRPRMHFLFTIHD